MPFCPAVTPAGPETEPPSTRWPGPASPYPHNPSLALAPPVGVCCTRPRHLPSVPAAAKETSQRRKPMSTNIHGTGEIAKNKTAGARRGESLRGFTLRSPPTGEKSYPGSGGGGKEGRGLKKKSKPSVQKSFNAKSQYSSIQYVIQSNGGKNKNKK